ncbi:unnamed protein product [Rhizophagus irregularis]|nr:unnamed protein product [Rhizophagus irregularis]
MSKAPSTKGKLPVAHTAPTKKSSTSSTDRVLRSNSPSGARNDNRSPPPDNAKRVRTGTAMETDEPLVSLTDTTSPPSGPEVASTSPSSQPNPSLTTPPTPQDISLNSSIHAQTEGSSSSTAPPSAPSDTPDRASSPDASLAAIQSDSKKFYAAASPNATEGFTDAFKTNRLACDAIDRHFSLFASYGSHARPEGSGDLKRIIIFFRDQADLVKAVEAPVPDLANLHFHPHDPAAIRAAELERSVFVTDIPLFISEHQVRGCFSRYGNIVKCKLFTRKLYQCAEITFDASTAADQFIASWVAPCCGSFLRVVPCKFDKSQRDARRAHVAILAGIPKNIAAADLHDIGQEVTAKAINIPLSLNSYSPKPYAYFTFASEDIKSAAMEISCSFRSIGLTWHQPNEVTQLCYVCGRKGCDPSTCSKGPSRSKRLNRDDKFDQLYSKFKPAQFRTPSRPTSPTPPRGRNNQGPRRASSHSPNAFSYDRRN